MRTQIADQAGTSRPLAPERARRSRPSLWKAVLGLVLGLALLALVVRGIQPYQVWVGMARARPPWLILAVVSVLLTTGAKVVRWRHLFPKADRPGYASLVPALLAGQLANALLLGRIGDVTRAYAVGQGSGLSKAMALGTVAAEKAFDLLFLLLCGGLAAALVPLPPWLDVPLIGLAVGGLALFVLAQSWPGRKLLAWLAPWAHRLPGQSGAWVLGVLQRGFAGLDAMRRPRAALFVCAWSTAVWILAASTNYLLFRAFDLDLPIGAAVLLLFVLLVGVVPPSSPAKLGVFHTLTILVLEGFGVERSVALAYAVVLHLVVYVPQVVAGALVFGLRLSPR